MILDDDLIRQAGDHVVAVGPGLVALSGSTVK